MQNTGCNVFLTGKAGTGKTTFLRNLYQQTGKRTIVLAPTGIAAINAGGTTLHSFFQLPFGPYIPGSEMRNNERNYRFSERKKKIIRTLDLVIIDEISMVRADVLDCVDSVLRRFRDRSKPFGGVQVLMIGDLQQLAPVAKQEEWALLSAHYDTPYFFSSHALKETGYVTVELKKVYRQNEELFVELLNKVRNNEADAAVLSQLNSRYIPNFVPSSEDHYVRIVTHNRQADVINEREMAALTTEPHTYKAEICKEFPEANFPTSPELTLKVGAQVMFIKNDTKQPRRYFNGMIGTVVSMNASSVNVLPDEGTETINVIQEVWEHNQYILNEKTGDIEEDTIGTFAQIPLKPAWAITVHKSQGLTFERAIIDVQYSFTHGQVYVALSRCRNLEGLVLSSPIPSRAIINDNNVVAFTRSIPQQVPSTEKLEEMKRAYFISLLADAFTFYPITNVLNDYLRHIETWLTKQHGEAIAALKAAKISYDENVVNVSTRFAVQYGQMVKATAEYETSAVLQERCRKGADWFIKELKKLLSEINRSALSTRNKSVAERENALRKDLVEQIKIKIEVLSDISKDGFEMQRYIKVRTNATIKSAPGKASKKVPQRKITSRKSTTYEDILEDNDGYDSTELAEAEVDYPDFDTDGLPY